MKYEVAVVVVWYNPEVQNAINNIESFIQDVGKLYVVDNSDTGVSEVLAEYLRKNDNIEYIALGENKGIAYALNVGARRAVEDSYEWLLTMDQDSTATPDMVSKLYEFVKSDVIKNVGIVAAQPDTPTRAVKNYEGYKVMESVIASGNLVNLEAYQMVGGFVDKLFIDYVDCVFSLAVRAYGFVIVQVNSAILKHNLGRITSKSFLGIKMYPTHHSPLRRYYIARNRLYMREMYKGIFPEFVVRERRNNLKMWIKILLYERNKWECWKMTRKGRRDFKRGTWGKYQD